MIYMLIATASDVYCMESFKNWSLQYVGGINQIILPVNRVTMQNAMVVRYSLNKSSSLALQVGHNFSVQNNLHDFRIGLRYQYELLRW